MRILTFIFILCGLSAQSQNTYRLDFLSDSTFYLVEIVARQPTPDNPAISIEYPQKFNDLAQLSAYTAYLRKQATEARDQAKKLIETAPRLEMAADKIDEAAKSPKKPVAVAPEPTPTKPPIAKPKTKKKKKA